MMHISESYSLFLNYKQQTGQGQYRLTLWGFGKIKVPLTEELKAIVALYIIIVIHRVKRDVGFGRSSNS